MAVGRRIGNALLQAMETATAAMEMQQKQKESKALERYRNAQAAHLERQGDFLDRLADTYNEDLPSRGGMISDARLVTGQPLNLGRSLPLPSISPPQLSHGDMISRQDPRHGPLSLPSLTPGGTPPAQVAPATSTAASPTGLPQGQQEFRFMRSGSPEAMQIAMNASGDGTSVVGGLPSSTFGAQQPDFRSGVTERLPIVPQDFELPTQFDTTNDLRRTLATFGGVTGVDTALPRDETQAWQVQMPFIEKLTTGFADMLTAGPTKMDYTNARGNQETSYQNLDLLVNSGAARGLFRVPQLRAMFEGMGISEGNFLSSSELNAQQMMQGATSDQIIQSESNRAMDAHNPLQRAMLGNPIGGIQVSEGPLGNVVTTQTLPEFDRRVLQNMIPLGNVVQRIGELATDLNLEEGRFIAGLAGVGQSIDSWWGTSFFTPEVEPMTQQQVSELWDSMNPGSSESEKQQGLARIKLLTSLRHAYAGIFAELGGERGRKTEDDVKRALRMVPGAGETQEYTVMLLDNLFRNMVNTYYGIVSGPIGVLGGGQGLTNPEFSTGGMPRGGDRGVALQDSLMAVEGSMIDQIEQRTRNPWINKTPPVPPAGSFYGAPVDATQDSGQGPGRSGARRQDRP